MDQQQDDDREVEEEEEDDDDMEDHDPIFEDIDNGDLKAVQQRVLADAAVLEEREGESGDRRTPLMWATQYEQPAMALWIIRHRGQHDLESADEDGWTALHYASANGLLEVVQALVAAGANPAALTGLGYTPLMDASIYGRTRVAALLLQLPAVKSTIDHINKVRHTALSIVSASGRQPIVQLLLDAGADPTIPAGPRSPLNRALANNHHAIAALLRHIIAEADRARALHKARSLLGAGAAALACLQGRAERGEAPPRVEPITAQQLQQLLQELQQPQFQQAVQERQELQQQIQQMLQECWQHQYLLHLHQQQMEIVRATAAFAVGVSGGEKDTGLCEDLHLKLLGYMLPVWADKGPQA